jgi:hypothetical protein
MDEDAAGPNRGDCYRETARLIRERAAKLRTTEARDTLNAVAEDYERLANYVEALWESATPAGPK